MTKTNFPTWINQLSGDWQSILKVHCLFVKNKITYADLLGKYDNYNCFNAYKAITERNLEQEIFELSQIENLEFLWLNGLKETVTDLALVENLKKLKYISLTWMGVSDLSPLSHLSMLEELTIVSGNVKDLSPLQNLQNLKNLRCTAQEKLTDLQPISNLTNLHTLKLGTTGIKNIKPIQNLKQLKILTLYEMKVTDISVLTDLNELTELDIRGTKIKTIHQLPKNLNYLLCTPTSGIDKEEMLKFVSTHPNCIVNSGKDWWGLNKSEEINLPTKPYLFNAVLVPINDPDILILTFVNKNNSKNYFSIQNTRGENEVHIEMNSQANGTYDGVEKITLTSNLLTVFLNEVGKKSFKFTTIEITIVESLMTFTTLKKELKKIFKSKFKS